MNVNLKNIKKSLFVTLLVVSASTFCVFPETNSKYIVQQDDYLKYSVDYKTHTYSNITIEKNPDKNVTQPIKTIGFIATFDRSDYLKADDEKVKYTFTVNKSACEITGTSPSSLFENSNKDNVATLTLNSNYLKNAKTKQVKVYYECTAADIIEEKDNNKFLSTRLTVKEQFNDEKYNYTLGIGSIDYAYDLFYTLRPHIETDKVGNKTYFIPKNYSVNDRYDLILENLITNSYPQGQNYFKQKYPDTDKSTIELDKALKGFSVGESVDGNYFTYTKDKYYYNYAYTNKKSKLYFDNLNSNPKTIWSTDEIVALLREYLYEDGSYYSKYSDGRKEEIINYVGNLNPSVKELLEAKTDDIIGGISYNVDSSIEILDSIIDYIDMYKPIEFAYEDSMKDIVSLLNKRISKLYPKLNANIVNSVVKTIQSTEKTEEKYNYLGSFDDTASNPSLRVIVVLHQIPESETGDKGKYYLSFIEVEKGKEYEIDFTQSTTIEDINLALDKFESENLIVSLGKDADNKDITEVTEDMLDRTSTLKITFTVVEKTISSYTTEDDPTKSEEQIENEAQENQENN